LANPPHFVFTPCTHYRKGIATALVALLSGVMQAGQAGCGWRARSLANLPTFPIRGR
jgi:hypothetical protein